MKLRPRKAGLDHTADPLTQRRHTGLDPVSSKWSKPLDSGLRRNYERVSFRLKLVPFVSGTNGAKLS